MAEERIFTARKFYDGTWAIEGVGCMSYLVEGSECAMLIDSGMSHRDLAGFVAALTDKPVTGVINTHGHFDHTGGNGWFDTAYMHPLAVKDAKRPFGDPEGYPLDYDIETVEESEIFDLGGRELEVIYIGAHSPGSIALLDSFGLLFTGDEIESGQVLLMSPDDKSTAYVSIHHENMLKIKKRSDEFEWICPGHNGSPIHKDYIDYFIHLDEMLMDGYEGSSDCSSPTFGFTANDHNRRASYMTASVVYDIRHIKK